MAYRDLKGCPELEIRDENGNTPEENMTEKMDRIFAEAMEESGMTPAEAAFPDSSSQAPEEGKLIYDKFRMFRRY